MGNADAALANLGIIGVEIHPHLAPATRLDDRDVDLRGSLLQQCVVASSIAHLHQAFAWQAHFDLAHRRIATVVQLDEQAGTVVHQPRLERFGEQLGVRQLSQFDQALDLIVAQLPLADAVDTPLQLLILELVAGFADALAELARIGEVGIRQ